MSGLAGPIWLVGCGKMGGALADGWLAAGLVPARLTVVEAASEIRDAWAARGALTVAEPAALPAPDRPEDVPQALVVAVKPQQMASVLASLAGKVPPATAVVSIAAGTPIATFTAALGAHRPVVRAMPNTPAAIGRGATALVANAACDDATRALATTLMGAVGQTVWLDDEAQMHAVTALSGSGPAYVFLLVEAMTRAAVERGLEPTLAAELARATVGGAGELVRTSAEPAATLRRNVTSPGGTTAAALEVLMAADGLQPLMNRAIAAAADRSIALAKPEDER